MTNDSLYSLGILEGFVSRSTAIPENVRDAIRVVRAALDTNHTEKLMISTVERKREFVRDVVNDAGNDGEQDLGEIPFETTVAPPEKKKRVSNMSPENRAKAALRFRKYRFKIENDKRVQRGESALPEPDWNNLAQMENAVA